VTREDDFQQALDARPDDWQTRLVFADWLQDRDDSRADGYRALGAHRARPVHLQMESGEGAPSGEWCFIYGTRANDSPKALARYAACFLPPDWFAQVPATHRHDSTQWWRYFASRRAADEAAVAAFARLPAARRSELSAAPLPPLEPPAEAAE
jgi:uncharacterized protein (TIGR02996 family)